MVLSEEQINHMFEDEDGFNSQDKNDLEITAKPSPIKLNSSFTQWSVRDGSKYTATTSTVNRLKPGFYELGIDNQIGIYAEFKNISTDELYELPSEELTDIIEDIEKFWSKSHKYKEYGFLHKRGILLYGEPGAGKSGIIQLCTKHLIERMEGIVINITNSDHMEYYDKFITHFRSIEPERPLIVILEDIDAIAGEGTWSTSMLLNLLDGVKQIDNVVYIATTNYPEKLEERITNRPSRFDRRYEILVPSDEVRSAYITNKLTDEDLSKIDLEKWVKETEGLSLAHMRELIISVVTMENSFEDTMNRLNGLKVKPRIKGGKKQIGFGDLK